MQDIAGRRAFLKQLGLLAAAGLTPLGMLGRNRPNVLWLMTDETRPDSLGCYGSPWAKTPVLDQLAEEGALFQHAYTPAPVCVPARSSLLTGEFPSTTGVYDNIVKRWLGPDTRFLTWVFETAGYKTASFGKKHYFFKGKHQAFSVEHGRATDDFVAPDRYLQGFDERQFKAIQYPGQTRWILGGLFPVSVKYMAEYVNVNLALQWMSRLSQGDRFFVRLSLNAPHTPVVIPKYLDNTIPVDSIRLPFPTAEELRQQPKYMRGALREYQGSFRLDHNQILRARQFYYERVSFADSQMGRLLAWMNERGLLENTVVVYTADHGALLGDHGLFQKQTFYEQVATVPFIFWQPRWVRSGTKMTVPVSTLSLIPTLIELAGLIPAPSAQEKSLMESITSGKEPEERPIFSEIKFGYRGYRDNDRLVMVRHGRFKLFLFLDPDDPSKFAKDPEGSLYDLASDPDETQNLFHKAENEKTIDNLRKEIITWDAERHRSGA